MVLASQRLQITCLENGSWSESGYEKQHWPKVRIGRSIGMCRDGSGNEPGSGRLGFVGIEWRFQRGLERWIQRWLQQLVLERQQRFQWFERLQQWLLVRWTNSALVG